MRLLKYERHRVRELAGLPQSASAQWARFLRITYPVRAAVGCLPGPRLPSRPRPLNGLRVSEASGADIET